MREHATWPGVAVQSPPVEGTMAWPGEGGLTVLMFCCAVSVPAGHHIAEGLQESKPLCNDVLGQ